MRSKRAQVTIFIIIAVVLVAGIIGYLMFKDRLFQERIPSEIEPIYATLLGCLESESLVGIDLLESQAGYIELPDFEPGSEHMPFSSQLNFLGNPIPYWYYVSGNNIQEEQVPSKAEMENQLESFIEGRIRGCDFESYYEQGFEISTEEPRADVTIGDNNVKVNLEMDTSIIKEGESFFIRTYSSEIDSKLGKLYTSAKKIYDKEQETLFLESYAVDTLRLYAPVDGVEISCSPLTWNANDIFTELGDAIEANTLALKADSGSFSLNKKENEYFVVDLGVDEEVRFLNSKTWSNGFEVAPADGVILISKPVGVQPGLGALGFCYVPYHFVYNIKYPVLVQVYDSAEDEIFQFPVAVILQGNNPREPLDVSSSEIQVDLCEFRDTELNVNVYDTNLNPVEADVSFECIGSSCYIGKTEQGKLTDFFPQCVNGYIMVRATGFEDSKYLYSTTKQGSVDIIMDKLYDTEIGLKLDNLDYQGNAIISFVSEKGSKTIIYPEQKTIKLSEGQYEIQVYIQKSSSISLPATNYEQCIEVPKSGIGSVFGLTEEKCFQVEVPSQIISNVLAGGGKQNHYILESELKNSRKLEINAKSLSTPATIEQLQTNYELFESNGLDIIFK